ncbi:hypothetical protein SCOCK_130178 [Actinacidiphila cocklensis]|uniref:Uncharacterized protein n=1 Tax=Actinacidiphila cocklensis TaxID=887465 RepID=A0A9W4DKL9_9ACTN|nr:hypothetical protein SCOCK_130178 [Actinacidiphila cocklensis]
MEAARESSGPLTRGSGRRRSKSSLESLRHRYRAGEADLKSGRAVVTGPAPPKVQTAARRGHGEPLRFR